MANPGADAFNLEADDVLAPALGHERVYGVDVRSSMDLEGVMRMAARDPRLARRLEDSLPYLEGL